MGIASSVIAVLTAVIEVILLWVVLGAIDRDAETSPLVPLGFLGCVLLHLVGLALGVAGALQRRRKRLFPVVGTILNGLFVFAIVTILFGGVSTSE